jgi:uncharacterized Rmd1/YagE family protein
MAALRLMRGNVRTGCYSALSKQFRLINTVSVDGDARMLGAYLGNPVATKAYFIARSIEIHKIHSNIYGSNNKQEFHSKSVTVTIDESLSQYIAVFKYGSVVMFNIPEVMHVEHLRKIKEVAVISPIAEGMQHTEDFKVIVNEHLDKPSGLKSEHLNIRCLDSKNLAIVSTVMAQTVALDYCEVIVNRIVEQFMHMNVKIEESGKFDDLNPEDLYRLVAANNTVITNVLTKLGIFEGSDAAWENQDYSDTFELLRKDFEIDNRFKDLSLKLEHVKDNARFFLEILHNNKSTKLEWIIIILIAAEIFIGLTGLALTGLGGHGPHG